MINISWVTVVLCACLIYGLGAICLALNEKIGRKQRIIEAPEGVIEAAIGHGYVEDSRSEGDYDLNVRKEGTKKIEKILEGIV